MVLIVIIVMDSKENIFYKGINQGMFMLFYTPIIHTKEKIFVSC